MSLKVLYAASEVVPLAKTGGLADVAGSLPLALAKLGADVRVIMPAYRGTLERVHQPARVAELKVRGQPFVIWEGRLQDSELRLWLVEHAPLYAREGDPYRDARGQDWGDNAWRFGCFSEAVARLALGEVVGWHCDVLHANDWQSGLAAVHLRDRKPRPKTVLTIHNLAYQGRFGRNEFDALGLDAALWHMGALEFHGGWSMLKGGIVFSDAITTVSPTYSREIQTPAFGEGLDGLLRARSGSLHGILNGIDDQIWNPATDLHLAQNYGATNVTDGKRANKQQLQRELGLQVGDAPLLGVISRLAHQKGMDLLLAAAPELMKLPVQIVVLGAGDAGLQDGLRALAAAHPQRVAVRIGHDERLAHRIEAGADIFLMPSRYEPCGLNQMFSQRYGTIPVVRRVGGLADTVVDATPKSLEEGTATGVSFEHADTSGVLHGIDSALKLRDSASWLRLQQAAMRQDFSWRRAAAAHIALYRRI